MHEHLRLTIGDLLDQRAEQHPDKEALVYSHKGLRLSYAEFKRECELVAKGLMSLGIQKGEHVSIWATNLPEWVILQFATAKMGAVLVTININYRSHELKYVLEQSDSTTLFLERAFRDTNYVETLYSIAPELRASKPKELKSANLPLLKRVVFIGDGKTPEGMLSFQEIREMGMGVKDEALRERQKSLHYDEVINMQYTSGTTGFPKGAMLSHFNIINNAFMIGQCLKLTEKDRLCIPVPFFHCFGCVLGTLTAVTYGATMVPIETFDPLKVLEIVEREKCTVLHGVPTMFIAELEHPEFEKFDLSSLRTGIMAGAPCPIEVMKKVVDKMHAKEMTIAYGQTEASPVITQTRTEDLIELRVSTVGRALPDVEVKIVDPQTGQTLPHNVPGELCARGYLVMKGYYKMPDKTKEAIDEEGWLHTGDLALMDEKGYCKITGRIKDMIIRGGENIYPREIEEFLYTHPAVSDVQVVGVPSKKFGEEAMAFIKLKEGAKATEEEIKQFCQGKISRFKVPKYIKFVKEYPMTASGKVQKYLLRQEAIKDLHLEQEAKIETA